MSVVNGNDIGIYVNGQLIGCLTQNSFSSKNDEIEVTCKDNNGAYQSIQGGNKAEMPFAGFFNPASGFGFPDLIAIHKNKTEVTIAQISDDNLSIYGQANLPEIDWSSPLNAGSTFSGRFQVIGEWVYSTT